MKPRLDQLAAAIMHLGYDEEDTYPTADIPFDVWKELQKRGHVERAPNGEPVLTAKGRKTYTALESRDNVPEFDYAGEED